MVPFPPLSAYFMRLKVSIISAYILLKTVFTKILSQKLGFISEEDLVKSSRLSYYSLFGYFSIATNVVESQFWLVLEVNFCRVSSLIN